MFLKLPLNIEIGNRGARLLLMAAASSAVLSMFLPDAAYAACSLPGPVSTWTLGGSGNWFGSGGWDTTDPNSGAQNVCITDGTSTVTLGGSASVNNLALGLGNTLDLPGQLNVFGSTLSNAGTIVVQNGILQVSGASLSLSGGGTVQMTGNAFIDQSSGGQTLINVDNLIEGTGQIGQDGLALNNESGGTVDANVNGGTLFLNAGGAITNAGLLEATNGGTLQITNAVNNTGGNITADGGTVNLAAAITGGTLNTINSGVLQNIGTTTLNGVTLSSGSTFTVNAGTTLLQGTITNNGTFTNPDGSLTIVGNVMLTGGGTVAMTGNAFFNQNSGGQTLFNVNNLIEGTGQLGQNGMSLDNESGGTVNANIGGGTLFLNGGGTVTNTGLLEATSGGTLQISDIVTNTGANITADGGTVNFNSEIDGGTITGKNGGVLQNIGGTILNGLTLAAGSNFGVGGTTSLKGAIVNDGTFTSPNGSLTIIGDVTLTGGGTVAMTGNAFFNQNSGGQTLFNVNNLIEGTGQLGQNGMLLDNEGSGTVNANIGGGTLALNGGGAVTNTGLLEATNGGILQISDIVTNTGANITADGGTVNFNSEIDGGTITGKNGGVLQNIGGTILNGLTLAAGSNFGVGGTTSLKGTIVNNGTFTSPNGSLTIIGDVTLTGGGTVAMTSNAFFNQNSGGQTLFNVNNLIEGTGQLGQNGMLLDNESSGTVNANIGGGTLALNGGGAVTNTGLLEATNGGILQISDNVTNTGANITANGGTVNVQSTITGGTLNTTGGGVMQTVGGAVLNGVTLSTGSTYIAGGTTQLEGTITNKGTITVPNTILQVVGSSVTLTGGGTVQMSQDAFFDQNSGGQVLNNADNTIEGTGQLGQNGLSLNNESGGTVYANAAGGTLTLNGGGTVTNSGLFEVAAGSELHVANVAFTNYAASTLTGGAYEIFGAPASAGTMQIDPLGSAGGEIVNNDASIVLDGVNSNLVDAAGKDALSNFNNNESGGSFTILDGRNFTSPGAFANAGNVTVGSGSAFSAGTGDGLSAYNQSSGNTRVDGTLTATAVTVGNSATLTQNGGELEGTGTVVASLFNYGTVKPGDPGSPGTLAVSGNFTQGGQGTLEIDIAGTASGQYSQLDVTGHTTLAGTLAVQLLSGFSFAQNQTFDIVNTDPFSGDFSGFTLDGVTCTSGGADIWNCSNLADGLYLSEEFLDSGDQLWLEVNGTPTQSNVPEPGTLFLFGGALVAAAGMSRKRKKVLPA